VWGKWEQFPDVESLQGEKTHNNVINTFSKQYICFRKTSGSSGGAKLVSCPRRHLTSLHPYTSRLSSQNGEICLQNYLPISGKLSITNNLKQNAVDYRNHLAIENNFKVEKKIYYLKTSTTFPPPKKRLGYA